MPFPLCSLERPVDGRPERSGTVARQLGESTNFSEISRLVMHAAGHRKRWRGHRGELMDAIPLPFYEVVPLDDIAPGVKGVRILFVNVFALGTPAGGFTLIDAGLYMSAGKIKHWLESHFGKGAKPEAIILTHGHFDHVGAVKELVDEWNVPVYAHPDEFPYLTGHAKYPPPDPSVGGGLMAVMSPLYPRTSADLGGRVQPLPADGSVPTLPN